MKNISSVSKWPFQHTKMAILRKWGYVLKWPFWGNGGMVANSTNSGAFYTILTNIWHPWRSWVRLHMEVQLELWEKFESNLLVWHIGHRGVKLSKKGWMLVEIPQQKLPQTYLFFSLFRICHHISNILPSLVYQTKCEPTQHLHARTRFWLGFSKLLKSF